MFANTCSSRNSGQGGRGLNFSLSMYLPLNCFCLAVCPQLRMLLYIFLKPFMGRKFVLPYPLASFIYGFDVAESCLCTSRLFQVNLPIDQFSSFMPPGGARYRSLFGFSASNTVLYYLAPVGLPIVPACPQLSVWTPMAVCFYFSNCARRAFFFYSEPFPVNFAFFD